MPPSSRSREKPASNGKIANRLVALSSAAVLTVYAAGYMRTRAAAQRFDAEERPRVVIPAALLSSERGAGQALVTSRPHAAPADNVPSSPPSLRATAPKSSAGQPAPAESSSKAADVNKAAAPGLTSTSSGPASASPAPKAAKPVAPAATLAQAPAPGQSSPVSKMPQAPTPGAAHADTVSGPAIAQVAAAPVPAAEPPAAPAPPPGPQFKDGTYNGWGWARHGEVEATVVVEDGRIVSTVISTCWTQVLLQVDRASAGPGHRTAER